MRLLSLHPDIRQALYYEASGRQLHAAWRVLVVNGCIFLLPACLIIATEARVTGLARAGRMDRSSGFGGGDFHQPITAKRSLRASSMGGTVLSSWLVSLTS